jgi:hypothetical protein
MQKARTPITMYGLYNIFGAANQMLFVNNACPPKDATSCTLSIKPF